MDHYYINPKTGRTIKKDGKKYKELVFGRYHLKKDPCLYNEFAAKKCLRRIMNHFPMLPIPSKTLPNNITVIRNKQAEIHGVVSESGDMYRLEYPIQGFPSAPKITTVSDNHTDILNTKLSKSDVISSEYVQEKLKETLQNGQDVMFNPLHDNFVEPVTEPILKEINNRTTPETLPIIPDISVTGVAETGGITGVIRSQSDVNKVTGYINGENKALKFNKELNLKISDLQSQLISKEQEILNLKKEINKTINNNNKTTNEKALDYLNKKLIAAENEKDKISKQCENQINQLMVNLGSLNVKISQIEQEKDYYYSLVKQTLEKWNPIEDDPEKYKSYAQWLKDIFVGVKPLKKTDSVAIEDNLNTLVERANMYANSNRSKIEMQKLIDDYNVKYNKLLDIKNNLEDKLVELPYLESQINTLTRNLGIANKRYDNSKITRDLLIQSYEKTIKGYLDAIESLKDNNVNIGVEMGLLKNKYNDLKELQNQLNNTLQENPDNNTDYDFITKYFNVSQDYSILTNLIKEHEQTHKQLSEKNTQLEKLVLDLQRKLKETSNVNIVNNLDRYKKAFKEIQTKYQNLIKENNNNLNKIVKLTDNKSVVSDNKSVVSDTETLKNKLSDLTNELNKYKQEKINNESKLKECMSSKQSIVLSKETTETLPSESSLIQDSIKDALIKQQCNGVLQNELGVKYILKWNDQVQKCIQEEIRDPLCKDNEMFNASQQKCLPCEKFDLIWDPISKKCIQKSLNIDIGILEDQNNNILGYNVNDNNVTESPEWQQPKNGKHK